MTVTPINRTVAVTLAPRLQCPKCARKAVLGFSATRTRTAYGQTHTQTLTGVCRPCARAFSASNQPEPLAVSGTSRAQSFREPLKRLV